MKPGSVRRGRAATRALAVVLGAVVGLAFVACAAQPNAKTAPASATAAPAKTTAVPATAPASPAPAAPPAEPLPQPLRDDEVREDMPTQPQAAAAEPFKGPQPPDGKWLTDEQGRQYFTTEAPRYPGGFAWVDAEPHKKVRLAFGLIFDLVSYDEEKFVVKIYRSDDTPSRPIQGKRPPTTLELRAIQAAYEVDTRDSDRLELVPFGVGLPTRGQWRNGFDIADIDRDGHPDIVFGPPRKGGSRPAIFLGDRGHQWRRWTAATFPPLPFDYGDAKVGDLNGDGIPDLVLASHLRGIVAMLGDGLGHFTAWSQGIDFQPPEAAANFLPYTSRAITLVDWNRDGRLDILAQGEGPRLARAREEGSNMNFQTGSRGAVLYLNGGDGTWKRIIHSGAGNFGDAIATADFNRDGRVDFVTASGRRYFASLLNPGQADGSWKETPLPYLRPGAIFHSVAVADFDGDGRPDIAVGYEAQEEIGARTAIDVLLNREKGWKRKAVAVVEGSVEVTALAAGDLDGDHHPDLVAMTGEGEVWVLLGDGQGGFTREASPEVMGSERCRGYAVKLADLDGDGADEVVLAMAEEPVSSGLWGEDKSCPSQGGVKAWKAHAKP